jgi:hypothetical protein
VFHFSHKTILSVCSNFYILRRQIITLIFDIIIIIIIIAIIIISLFIIMLFDNDLSTLLFVLCWFHVSFVMPFVIFALSCAISVTGHLVIDSAVKIR